MEISLGTTFKVKLKSKVIDGKEVPCENDDFNESLAAIKDVVLYNGLVDKTARDEGTCVLGAGIKLPFVPKGKISVYYKMFFRAPFQGTIGSYKALKPVLEYLKKEYPQLNFYWEDGVMD